MQRAEMLAPFINILKTGKRIKGFTIITLESTRFHIPFI
jgi:hypothetical protein